MYRIAYRNINNNYSESDPYGPAIPWRNWDMPLEECQGLINEVEAKINIPGLTYYVEKKIVGDFRDRFIIITHKKTLFPKYLERYLQNTSLPEELKEDWAKWVCKPVITCCMGPREARAILEVAGRLKNLGISSKSILLKMLKMMR